MISPIRELREAGGRALPASPVGLGELTTAAVVGGIALIAGALAVKSLQAGTAFAVLVLLVAVHGQSRRAGMFGLWTIWLLTPGLRRLLALAGGTPTADPLSLLPFVATAILALIEMRRTSMSREAQTTVGFAALGFMIGAPMGLKADPVTFAYSAMAYLSGVGALVLGWVDARERGRPTLIQVLVTVLPLVAVYGIFQYFFPLTSWDLNWIETVKLASIGSPQAGHIRIFATLNSPGTFALVLAVAIILGLGLRRRPLVSLASNLAMVLALALTFVRSSWLALALGAIVFSASTRGRSAKRLVIFIVIFIVLIFGVGGSNPTTRAFTERITTLGQLGSDESAQVRLGLAQEIPAAVSQPLGSGLGTAGQSQKLSESGGGGEAKVATDNGYLALLTELGLVGLVLVVLAMARGVRAALRMAGTGGLAERQARSAVLAALVALILANAGGDILYGVTGAIFWYLAGIALAADDDPELRLVDPAGERPG